MEDIKSITEEYAKSVLELINVIICSNESIGNVDVSRYENMGRPRTPEEIERLHLDNHSPYVEKTGYIITDNSINITLNYTEFGRGVRDYHRFNYRKINFNYLSEILSPYSISIDMKKLYCYDSDYDECNSSYMVVKITAKRQKQMGGYSNVK